MALTRRQKQVLDFLVSFISDRGYSPSFDEVREGLDLSSLATVHKHIENLERKGFIRRGYNQSRSIDVVALPGPVPFTISSSGKKRGRQAMEGELATAAPEFPLLGRIAAGHPVEAYATAETFSLGEFTQGKGQIFVLKVKGDSMIDDHICEGDYILVQQSKDALDGEIVVALVEGTDATLKRFFRESDGNVRLQPANSQMNPIILAAARVEIQGRVIGVLRKY